MYKPNKLKQLVYGTPTCKGGSDVGSPAFNLARRGIQTHRAFSKTYECVCIYIYTHIHVCIFKYIYTYISICILQIYIHMYKLITS